MAIVLIGVGSNLGDRLSHIEKAREILKKSPQIKILAESAIYETVPQGGPPQGFFLNSVWKLETTLEPVALFKELQSLELKLGRVRKEINGPRTIDLDILDYDGMILETPELTLPHPRLHEREFVLRPIFNLVPDWIHPKLRKSAGELWTNVCHSRESGNLVSLVKPLDPGSSPG